MSIKERIHELYNIYWFIKYNCRIIQKARKRMFYRKAKKIKNEIKKLGAGDKTMRFIIRACNRKKGYSISKYIN